MGRAAGTVAALLAAGSGSRFSGDTHKLLATVRGETVFAHSLRAVLDAGFDHVLVVTGAAELTQELAPHLDRVTVAHNARHADGMATSLDIAVSWARSLGADAVVVGLADQPFAGHASWRAVADSPSPIAVATFEGRQRNPVKLSNRVWSRMPIRGDDGARSVLRMMPELVEPVACDGFPDDIDTVEDLQRWS